MLGDEYRALMVAAGRMKRRGKPRRTITVESKYYVDIWRGEPPEVARRVTIIHGPPRLVYRDVYGKGDEFTLSGGALGYAVKVKSFAALTIEATRNTPLGWTLVWSNICEELFNLAKRNPMVAVFGQLDYLGWTEHIQARRRALGLDDTKPALTFPEDSEKCEIIYNASLWANRTRYVTNDDF